jgi:hypothetical protein
MTGADELGRTLAAIAQSFAALGVRWAVGGSIASAAHGEPRATNDVDVVAMLSVDQARALVDGLHDAFYADRAAAEEAVRRRSSFNLIDQVTFIKIDVFVPAPGPLGSGQLDRVRVVDIVPGAPPLPILGPEDVVLQKLRWFKMGGEVSDRQWRDILSVLRLSAGALDTDYLANTAENAGMRELLERALRDASGV